MNFSRREFAVGCSTAIAALAGGRLGGLVFANPADTTPRDILVIVFLRGGCDSLNFVAPTSDQHYADARPDLRVKDGDPNTDTSSGWQMSNPLAQIDFRFHNKAKPLLELYQSGDLAVVHACGLTNGTRSHFDAMDYIERGTPTNKNTSTGWLTRHLVSIGADNGSATGLPAVAAASNVPTALLGSFEAASMARPTDFKLNSHWKYGDDQRGALRKFYSGDTALHSAGIRTLDTIDQLQSRPAPNPDVTYPPEARANGLKDSLRTIAHLIKMDMGLQVATVDYGGWDTHEGQTYVFPNQIESLAYTLQTFYNYLSAYHSRLTVVVMSEFGRRLKENESGGTDHGHGGVMLVLGGGVKGGRMYGSWPGLTQDSLDNGVDLAVTTDYRTVLSEILMRRLRNPKLGQVFPGISAYTPLNLVEGTDQAPDFTAGFSGKVYMPLVTR
jgi:uncharacterized protein (DUF1501 family)